MYNFKSFIKKTLIGFGILALFFSCSDPVAELQQATDPQTVVQVWQRHQTLVDAGDIQADDFVKTMSQKVSSMQTLYPQDAGLPSLQEAWQAYLAKRQVHYNIIIVPDLSMRIHPDHYPFNNRNDRKVIALVGNLFKELVEKKYFGHKDRLSLRLTDPAQFVGFDQYTTALDIDLGKVPMREMRDYIDELPQKLTNFNNTVNKIYDAVATQNPKGADIWKFFNEDLDDTFIKPSTLQDSVRNIVVLLTDGYIEAGKYGKAYCQGNECEYLSNFRIQAFRQAVLKSGKAWDLYYEEKSYGISPVRKPERFSNVEVLALEFYDRFPKKNPSDFLIVQRFWEGWFKANGIRGRIEKSSASLEDTHTRITNFLSGAYN